SLISCVVLVHHSYSLSRIFLFVFYVCDHHRDFHSFPTRRSSDLNPTAHQNRSAGRWRSGTGFHAARLPFHTQTDRISAAWPPSADRKSTRLNSSHVSISYAVFCLKKKKNNNAKICHIYTINVLHS